MERVKRKRTYLKLISFIAVLLLLTSLSQIKLPQEALATGFVPIPDEYRGLVSLETVNRVAAAILAADEHGDVGQLMTEYEAWKVSEGIVITPSTVNTQGCATAYINNLELNFTLTHSMFEHVRGTVKVEVCNYDTGFIYAAKLLSVDFLPGQKANRVVKFSIVTPDPTTAFLIKITFPTAEELAYNKSGEEQVSLLEYITSTFFGLTPH